MIKSFSKFKIAIFACLLVIFASNLFNFIKDDKIWRAENVRAATSCKGPADVILVIDRSATMADSLKFSAAKSASVNFIDKLFATEPDSSYGSCAYHQIGLVAFNNNIDSESLNQSGSLIQNIINQSDGILGSSYPSDYRRTSTAIEIAKNKLDPDLSSVNSCATKTMIVLTDGAPYYDIASARAHADSAKSKDIRIVSVGLKLDEIVDSGKRTEAEDFIKYPEGIASTSSDCYYISESGNTLDGCTTISATDLETALDGVYNNITAAVCDESPPSVEIYRTPQNTLYSVDKLVIKSVATDDIGFESHTLRWSDNWANPGDITEIACGNLSGTVIECSTEELGPFSVGDIISYRSTAKDANGNEASIDLPDPRSVTVANVSLNVPALFRNVNNGISVTISDPNGKADLDSFYITVDAPVLAGIEIEKAAMSCSGSGSSWICTYNFNTANVGDGCLDWTDGITDGKANNINVNIYVYADSDDMAIRQIASAENQLLVSHYEGISYSGTCSDGINNDCDYDISNDPIIDAEEMSCDAGNPLVGISRVPSSDVYDDDSITFTSTAGDPNGIKQHTIYYREDGGVWQIAFDCNDANADDLCDEDASQNIANISATIGPFAAGTVVEYYSTAVDYSGNDNTGNSATESFIVKNRECFEKNDLDDCNVTPDGKCCGEVCNAAISNPNSYNTDYCAEEVCNGISWEWNIDSSKNNVICSDGGNSDGCYSFLDIYGSPPGDPPYFFDGGCEERGYTCSSGYCTYGVVEGSRNEDHCIGGGSLILNDYECSGLFCVLDPNPAVGNDVCDVNLDYLSVNAYNSDNTFICGSSGAATGEALDNLNNLTNNVSLESITYDGNGIRGQKIYWKEISEASYNINNCNVDSCGDISNQCNCSQNIGPFNIGETVAFYASSKDDSPNQTENIMGSAGLRYYYYDGTNFNTYLGSDIDTDIDHDWGSGQVNINGNSWENQSSTVSIIWDGMITPDVLGVHTFYLYSDDGIRFDLGGNRLIDHWGYDNNEYSATYDFVSLEPVSIRIEWYEGWGAANLRLGWESPGGVKTYPIPSGNLIAPYSFTVRDGECYDVISGNEPNLTPCDSGNGMCCGGSCDSSIGSTSYDEECRVDSCSGTNWVYAAGNEGVSCGSADSCFDYYSPNISFYSGCITGGNKCSSGSCVISSSLTSTPICNGNLLTNYNCDPNNATGTCQPKDSDIDCSVVGNYDSDSVDCNCDCNGYDLEEKVYSSLSFDGMDDYVDCGDIDALDIADNFTVEFWFKRNSDIEANSNHNISNVMFAQASDPDNDNIEIGTDNTYLEIYLDTASYDATLTYDAGIQNDVWYHFVFTYDSDKAEEAKLYFDGVNIKAWSNWGGALDNSSTSPVTIGNTAHEETPFNGLIDDVRIYNRVLYPEEITDQYNGIFADDTGLIGYWNFDEGTGETAYDYHDDTLVNNNNGTLKNGPVWMKHYHDSSENNVPINWQVCTDGKDNNCDTFVDNYDSINGISNCDGEVDAVYVTASAENSDGVENSDLFNGNLGITTYDIDIERVANNFMISTFGTTDEFSIQQTIIEWTTDNWANKSEKVCNNTGLCEVCVEGGTCGEENDLIPSSSLSAGKIFNFRVCAWDDSINHNKKCTDYHGIIILGSNLVPEITPLSVQEPNFCAGLSYALNWNFVDPDDGQASYKIQVEEGDSDFTNTSKLVIDAEKYLTEDSYLIPDSTDSDFISGKSIEYGKTYNWRVKVTDDRGGGYEQTTEWEKGPSFTAPEYEYPQVDFSATLDHSNECLYEIGYSGVEDRCDFGEDITFSDDSVFIECTDLNDRCLTASAAKCDTANNICVPCGGNDDCVKFKYSSEVHYFCNVDGVCEASGSCTDDVHCKTANAAKCDTESGLCISCDDDLQCTNDKFGTTGIDYFCNSDGACEDREHRKWYFYDDLNVDSADPNPVNNYIDSVVDSYVITLEIKDVLGNSCYKKKNIFLGGKKYPKWNEMSPSSN